MVLFAVSILGLISFFTFISEDKDIEQIKLAYYFADSVHATILFLMTIASIKIYGIIADLDVNPHPVDFLDDLLLFVCVPAHFVLAICIIMPSVYYVGYLAKSEEAIGQIIVQSLSVRICERPQISVGQSFLCNSFLQIVQVCVQTPMIVDGLRRCSESPVMQKKKPGRQVVTFLLGANLTVYLWDNMKVKSQGHYDVPSQFYEPFMWKVVHHACLPLTLFYRFHAAVALADMWSAAYRAGDHEDPFANEYEKVKVLPPEAENKV